jgi:AcrR family transcriptional regulator
MSVERTPSASAEAGGGDRFDVEETAPAVIDGRLLRSERTREAIADALLDLVKEGNPRPSSAQIAARAGVTQRTLFNQFGDMESLLRAVSERQAGRIAHLLPTAGDGDLSKRAGEFCDGLGRLLEEVVNLRWAVVTNPASTEHFGRSVELMRQVMRTQLRTVFRPELSEHDEATQERTIDLLEVETDPVTWRLRRLQLGLSVDQAREQVERAIVAVLRDL